ncbi:hypothetical protein Clacol_000531 [Clathrus columnatus]|uniref:AAA+ ATPase domain-containing protein n=1 Tax=Clathrus columnatus TaxID=1419009 RepID=A0AAV5A375_9AGAM|nr:hypothetical protein Clacol_000531 [Clathrus columnatus]
MSAKPRTDLNCQTNSTVEPTSPSSSLSKQPSTSSQTTSISTKKSKSSSLAPIFTQGSSSKRSIEQVSGSIEAEFSRSEKRQKAASKDATTPLAERLRPQSFSDFFGQEHLVGPDALLKHVLQGENGCAGSMILWGPSGCGKTTLARLLATSTDAMFKELSATSSGTNDVRAVFEEAKKSLSLTGRQVPHTILFLDEIHRFNKAQQDIFLPYVEQGHIQVVPVTDVVFVLEKLTDENITDILDRALERVHPNQQPNPTLSSSPHSSFSQDDAHARPSVVLTDKVKKCIVSISNGDARTALSLLELLLSAPSATSEQSLISILRKSVSTRYDRTGDSHYDMISALHKSVRGSDGSAALYWLARMLTAGEDPLYIARRLIVMASEDIGLANNQALPLATSTLIACQNIGMPECRINLAHCVAYLAESPKSTRAYEAYNRAEEAAKKDTTEPVPLHLRNAPTKLMKELSYGQDYLYNPSYAHPVYQEYFPPNLFGSKFLRQEDDVEEKVWDEKALKCWERECNEGKPWEGRTEMNHSAAVK